MKVEHIIIMKCIHLLNVLKLTVSMALRRPVAVKLIFFEAHFMKHLFHTMPIKMTTTTKQARDSIVKNFLKLLVKQWSINVFTLDIYGPFTSEYTSW